MAAAATDVRRLFGDIDIYLFDQILRGRIQPGQRIFDAGCGGGRNLVFLLREGYDVCGIDSNPQAVAATRRLAADLAPQRASSPSPPLSAHNSPDAFQVAPLERHPFADASADVVLASAVLHFANGHDHFDAMLAGAWRVVAPGGLFFARLASSIGIADAVQPLGEGRFRLPDGSDRYLVDEGRLMAATAQMGGHLLDPLKTTVVQGQRAMTTWVVQRPR